MTKIAILSRTDLRSALAAIKPAIEKRNTIPILSNVRLAAHNGALVMTGTDLDVTISATIAATIDDGFDTTIPAHALADIEKKAPDCDHVAIDHDKPGDGTAPQASLDFEGLRIGMQALDPIDFPDMAFSGPIYGDFTLPTNDVLDMLVRTTFAISSEETRYYLNGVYLHGYESGNRRTLRAVATDGHRLAMWEDEAKEGVFDPETGKTFGVIIPRKSLDMLWRIAKTKGSPDSMRIVVNTNKVRIVVGNVEIVSKLIDGTFPDYQRVIPTRNHKTATMDASALMKAVTAVSTIRHERGNAVKFSFDVGKVELSVSNPDVGTARMTVPCDYDSEPMDIGFNAKYVQDILGALYCDRVTFALEDNGAPALVSDASEAARMFAVLMPIRI
jgi:DNA polymerase-3 subunit beta